jgi:uncharacterized protein YggE
MSSDGDGVTVVGSAAVAAPVDRVTITIGVEVVRPDAGEAFRLAGETVTRLLAVLADDGVDARAVRTLDLSLGPRTEWADNREVLIGYQTQQRLLVKLDGLAGMERLLTDVATRTGPGVRIENVALTAEHAGAAEAEARQRAWADARVKAEQYAGLAGRTLGAVVLVREGTRDGFKPYRAVALAAAEKAMPIAGGDTEVNATVTVRWRFAD